MSNNQGQLNRSIFNTDPLLPNPGDSPFPDPDQHSLFNPNFSTPQSRMMNGMGQLPTSGVHDINSLLSNQHNPQSYNSLPKPPLGAGPMGQGLALNPPIFTQQPQIPPLNINPQPSIPTYPGSGINQMQPQIIPQMPMMQPNNQYMQSTYYMDYYRNRMQTNPNLPPQMQSNMAKQDPSSSVMRLLMQRQKNPFPQHVRPRSSTSKKFVSDDNDEEVFDDVPSSEEATFSGTSEETDFENLADDYVPNGITQRRTAGRENRKSVQRDEDEVYIGEDEEESTAEVENEIGHEELLEHIYMNRVTEEGIEYLVRFQDSPPGLCSWVPEILVNGILNSKTHLDKYREKPFELDDIPEDSNSLIPVAHRRETPESRPELLFRVLYPNIVLFYWDFGKEDVTRNYFNHRLKLYATDPQYPTIPPVFDETVIKSKHGEKYQKVLLPYQVEGAKFLVRSWGNKHGSVLADEVGLKKKIQLLAFLAYLNKSTDWHGPFLIACSNAQFQHWSNEIAEFTDLRCLEYIGGPAQRSIMRDFQFPALDELGNAIPDTFSFNVFLVPYDILIKDIEFIQSIDWEVFVVDEWQNIKNKNGKKFGAISQIKPHHKIVLTDKPIPNSLEELWTLLGFVSPTYFQENSFDRDHDIDVDDLTQNQISSIRDKIRSHFLFRTVQEVKDQEPSSEDSKNSIVKDEKVAFVSLTEYQKDLIRLAKLHKLWRLKGYQYTFPEELDLVQESKSLLEICSHPFLIPNAESYYSENLKLDRVNLLLNVSSKFQFLDHVLCVLKLLGHRVIMLSKNTELLKLIDEFCLIRRYTTELISLSSNDIESIAEMEKFPAEDSDTFIYLFSSHAPFSNFKLSSPTTTIIFDPDWNPEEDINLIKGSKNAENQTINVIRLVTYQTYEHEVFVKSQQKLNRWLTILGVKTLDQLNQPRMGVTPIRPPPNAKALMGIAVNESLPLDQVLDSISSVVRNYSIESLDSIRSSLRMASSSFYNDVLSDEHFLEQFPLSSDQNLHRAKRNHSRDLLLDIDSSNKIYDLMLRYGYDEWNRISLELPEHSSEQIRRFCICLTIFAFRAMPPSNITYLPVLAKKVLSEDREFKFEILLCSNKHTWAQVFPEDHDYALEVDSCKKLKDKLHEHAFYFLSVVEMRLIAKCWRQSLKRSLDISKLSPPVLDDDERKLNAILEYGLFDPFDLRVQAIINQMRSELISAKLSEKYAKTFNWWTGIEFTALMSVLKNYKYNPDAMEEFHSRTAIMSKTTYQITTFMTRYMKMLRNRQKGSLTIPKDMHHMPEAPKTLQTAKGFTSWVNILVRECEDLAYRAELIDLIEKKIAEIPDSPETSDGWGEYHTKKFLSLLLQFGIDSLTDLLKDRRFGFKRFLSQSDLDFLSGKKKRRNLATSSLPDFLFNEEDLYYFVRGEVDPFTQDNTKIKSGPEETGEQHKFDLGDYQFSDDDLTAVNGKKGITQFDFNDGGLSDTSSESQTDEEQDDFKPDDE